MRELQRNRLEFASIVMCTSVLDFVEIEVFNERVRANGHVDFLWPARRSDGASEALLDGPLRGRVNGHETRVAVLDGALFFPDSDYRTLTMSLRRGDGRWLERIESIRPLGLDVGDCHASFHTTALDVDLGGAFETRVPAALAKHPQWQVDAEGELLDCLEVGSIFECREATIPQPDPNVSMDPMHQEMKS